MSVNVEAKLVLALGVLLSHTQIRDQVLLFSGDPPSGRHLHAWTFPADADLKGPGDSIGIAFRRSSLSLSWRKLFHILAHEVGHAALDIEAIRRGEVVECDRAEAMAKGLLEEAADELKALTEEG